LAVVLFKTSQWKRSGFTIGARGGKKLIRLVHAQEILGEIPSPATNLGGRMATISGFFYRIGYIIVTNPASGPIDPPIIVAPLAFALVNAASQQAAVTALIADLSLAGNQRLIVEGVTQVEMWSTTNYQ
jgi:hypothetical protein